MKNVLSVLFVTVLIWNYLGFFVYFQVEKQIVKKSIKKQLKLSVPREELVVFQFNAEEIAELIWHKSNEFSFRGDMFDIVYTDTSEHGQLIYTCISDHQETLLFKNLSEYIAKDLGSDKHKPLKTWLSNIDQPIIGNHISDPVLQQEYYVQAKFISSYFYSIQLGFLPKTIHPPTKVSSFLL